MKRAGEKLMRVGAFLGGTLVFLLLLCVGIVGVALLLVERASAAGMLRSVWSLAPTGLRLTAFTLSTAAAAVALSFPLAWALSTAIVFLRPRRLQRARSAVSGASAIPAVVFGYLGLTYFAPAIDSAWWGVTVTLILMSLMRHTLELTRIHERFYPAVEAAQSLGAYIYETMLHTVFPLARREYLTVALRMLARCMGEGVAILLVLSAYGGEGTLVTGILRAAGVTGEESNVGLVLLLAGLLTALVLLVNAVISLSLSGERRSGGMDEGEPGQRESEREERHGEEKTAQ